MVYQYVQTDGDDAGHGGLAWPAVLVMYKNKKLFIKHQA